MWSLVNGIIHFLLLFLLWHIHLFSKINIFSYFAVMHWKGSFFYLFLLKHLWQILYACIYKYMISYSIWLCRQKRGSRERRQVPQAQGLLPKAKNWPTSSTTVNEPPKHTTIHTGYASATDQPQILPHKHRI